MAATLYDDGYEAEARLQYTNAIPQFRKEIPQRPKDATMARHLGWALYKTGRLPEAAAALEDGASKFPIDTDMKIDLGSVYYFQRKYADTIRVCKQAIAIDS
jgi:tetratricopeptide (TPR) repeat protein